MSRVWISGNSEGYPSTSSAICTYGQKIITVKVWFFLDSNINEKIFNIAWSKLPEKKISCRSYHDASLQYGPFDSQYIVIILDNSFFDGG